MTLDVASLVILPGDRAQGTGRLISVDGVTYLDPLPPSPPSAGVVEPFSHVAVRCAVPPAADSAGFWRLRGTWTGQQLDSVEEPVRAADKPWWIIPPELEYILTWDEIEEIMDSIPPDLRVDIQGVGAPTSSEDPRLHGLVIEVVCVKPAWVEFARSAAPHGWAIVPTLTPARRGRKHQQP